MSQIWSLLRKDTNDHEHQHEAHETEQHTMHSASSSNSTIKSDIIDPIDHQAASPHQDHTGEESFDAQLRKKLSHLSLRKKKLKKSLHCKTAGLSNDELEMSEIDEKDDELKEIEPINIKSIGPPHPNHDSSTILSPSASYLSSSSSNIFERSVQDQATMSSISRRNSFNQMTPSFRSQSFTSLSPTQTNPNFNNRTSLVHLSSEVFIPTCLDASTEVLTNDATNLGDIEVIQSTNPSFIDVLDQTYYRRRASSTLASPTMSRRHTFNSITQSPPPQLQHFPSQTHSNVVSAPLTKTSTNTSFKLEPLPSLNTDIDYSDQNKLNFCSFADLLSDELLQTESQQTEYEQTTIDDVMESNYDQSGPISPCSRKNSSIFVVPALTLTKTTSQRQY